MNRCDALCVCCPVVAGCCCRCDLRRDVLSDGALLELLADFNHTVTAHEESLGDWLPPSRLKPNDWSARICCDPTTKPHPCWCDADT